MGTGKAERPSATVWLPPLNIYFSPEVPTASQNHLYALSSSNSRYFISLSKQSCDKICLTLFCRMEHDIGLICKDLMRFTVWQPGDPK